MNSVAPKVPSHVPELLVRDFDFRNSPLFQGDPHVGLLSLRDESPLFYTPHYGGHWVVTDGQAMREVYMDYERFTATVSQFTDPVMRGEPAIPMQVDPPVHTKYRKLINQALSPKAVKGLSDDIRAFAIELIEGVQGKGRCDFLQEVAEPFPVTIFLRLAGLPVGELQAFRKLIKAHMHGETLEEQTGAMREIMGYLGGVLKERRAEPGSDVYSIIAAGEVDGRPLSDIEMMQIALTIFVGGLDTVLNLMAFVIGFLARNPGHRQQLIDDPALIPEALEELMRRHGLASLFRGVKHDMEFHGVQLKQGERLWCHTAFMGLDETLAPDPLRVDFSRPNKFNTIFNVGPHFCPGAYLARMELRIFFEEWFKRIPQFRMQPGADIRIFTGNAMGPSAMPIEWDVP